MKLVLTTTYDNITEEWFAWYCKRLAQHLPLAATNLEVSGVAILRSENEGMTAETVYQVNDRPNAHAKPKET